MRRLHREEVVQLVTLVPVLQEVKPTPVRIKKDTVDISLQQLAQEISEKGSPSLHDEFLFGLTYEDYFHLSDGEAEALWDKAFAEESITLDREPEYTARPDVRVPA